MKKAIKVLQRDPDITNTAFGEDELETELRMQSMNKRKEDDQSKRRPAMTGGPGGDPNSSGASWRGEPQNNPNMQERTRSAMGMPPNMN